MKIFNHSFQRSASLSNKTQATLGTLQRMLYVFLWPVCYYKSLLMLAVVCSESKYTSVVSSRDTRIFFRGFWTVLLFSFIMSGRLLFLLMCK